MAVLMLIIASIGLMFWAGLRKWFHGRQQIQANSMQGSPIEKALAKVQVFSAAHPDWGLRVYETPKGLRIIVTHATLAPNAPETQTLFNLLEVDPLYALLCTKQQCFRARVSGKPWRMGLNGLSDQARRWPVRTNDLAARQQWVEAYEKQSVQFAACRYLDQLGSTNSCPQTQEFVVWHDKACKAHSSLALA